MSTRLLLEGPDIALLLAQVRAEHGTGARIVSADKVRSGGFAGFGARERFAVTIEVDLPADLSGDLAGDLLAPAAQPSAAPLPAAPSSLMDLAAAIDAAEVSYAGPAATAATMAPPPARGGGLSLFSPSSVRAAAPGRAARAAAAARPAPVGAGQVSTEGADFASVLADLAAVTAGGAGPDTRAFVPVTGPAATATVPAARPASEPALAPAPEPAATPSSGQSAAAGAPVAPMSLAEIPEPAVPTAVLTPPPVTTTDRGWTAGTVAPDLRLHQQLLGLGLPAAIAYTVAVDVMDMDLPEALLRSLRPLPAVPAPSASPGDVLVVAGEGAAAYAAAQLLATRMGLDPAAVLLAAGSALGTGVTAARRIGDPEDGRRRRPKLLASRVPTLVAVDVPWQVGAAQWAREMADSLGARRVWAVTDATRKPADAALALDALGRVDGLIVGGTEATYDPCTVLAMALERAMPTVLLEDRPGDAAAWVALIVERLAGAS